MQSITLHAHAKINLTLDVVGKLENGYHLLEMVMQSISLHDVVMLEKKATPGITLTCAIPDIPCDESNIAWKSAALFFAETGISGGVAIHLEKHIPSQAGLGGGSADGAAVLVGLNRLFDTRLSEARLCQLGVNIGADVPFCIVGGTRFCAGIGEKMTPLAPLPNCTVLLCKPPLNVSTKEAYAAIDRHFLFERPNHTAFLEALSHSDLPAIGKTLCNVFETALPLPTIQKIHSVMLQNGAIGSAMSGSGSTVFGLFSDPAQAALCASQLRQSDLEVHLAHPISRGITVA